jgi:hypothetical protein
MAAKLPLAPLALTTVVRAMMEKIDVAPALTMLCALQTSAALLKGMIWLLL